MSNGALPSLIGRTLGNRYVVERVLGAGAMGTVYCARQIGLGALVAVKVLHPRLATDAGLLQRFEREAFATSRLDHPNALRVLDCGEDGDLFYIVTEYVEAEDLLTIMEAQWPLGDERIVSILSQVLSALVAVHDVGIVHRDLKPENILVLADKNDDGAEVDVVKVCDFGIAKVARPLLRQSCSFAPRLTAAGVVVGTPDYMSPEQARGQAVDGRSDLYSVGVVLYHLLAGRTPFEGETAVGIALQHVSEAPVPPSHHRNVHPGLEAVCLRALSKQPDDRFQSAREMRKALRDALAQDSTALALVSVPVTSLRLASPFSSSSPAMLPLPQAIALHRLQAHQRRRRHWAFGYLAVLSMTVTGSPFVASRRGSTTDAIDADHEGQAGIALVSPPDLAMAATALLTAETVADSEPLSATIKPPPAPEPAPLEAPRRLAPGPRQQPKARAHTFVAVAPTALPVSSAAPAPPNPALLIRSDPWPSQADAPESPPSRPENASSASFDASRASVGIANVVTSPGISGAKVKVALSHVALSACYQQALRSRPSDAPLLAELRLTIDLGGRIVGAMLTRDGDLLGLRGCIESATRGARIRDVDTGDGSATVQLRFSPR